MDPFARILVKVALFVVICLVASGIRWIRSQMA